LEVNPIPDILIRKYKKEDRAAVRRICCDTAFMGEPVEAFFTGREVFADILTSYYTDYEPESLFVADSEGVVVGYLMGCKNTSRKERIFLRKILPKAIINLLKQGAVFKKKNALLLWNVLKNLFRGELSPPKIPKVYSAHLHIDIDSAFRRCGIGRRLIDAYFDYLIKNKVSGVSLGTFSKAGMEFFVRSGFTLLWQGKTSLWRYILHKDIPTASFGKILTP